MDDGAKLKKNVNECVLPFPALQLNRGQGEEGGGREGEGERGRGEGE